MTGELAFAPDLKLKFDEIDRDLAELQRRIQGGDHDLAMNDLADVTTDGLVDPTITRSHGDVLTWDNTQGLWVPKAPTGGGGSGLPITHVGPDATFSISIPIEADPLTIGGSWVSSAEFRLADTSSPQDDITDLWIMANTDDGAGGFLRGVQRTARAAVIGVDTYAEIAYGAAEGPAAILAQMELLVVGGSYIGFGGAPDPHIVLRSGYTPPTPGTPIIADIIIESGAFGPVNIAIGGPQGDLIGFFNTTPITQPAHPANVTDVINLLTALGLCA